MKRKNIIIIVGAIVLVGIITVVGISLTRESEPTLSDETLDLIQKNDQIELEIAVPIDQEEQGTQSELSWMQLSYINTYQDTLRTPMENILGITLDKEWNMKRGMIYENNSGTIFQNNTLKGALQNSEFRAAVDNDEIIAKLSDAAFETFIDLEEDEEMTNFYMAINAYFNLLPATEEGYANPQSALRRAEFMSLVMRAETPYKAGLKAKEDFTAAVGNSEYAAYAQSLAEDSYLDLESKSLNEQTFNTSMSRAEAIYMLMNHYYADELESLDISKASLDDTKDGDDIAKAQGYTGKDQAKAKELNYCISNPDKGVPTDIYKALVFAEQKGLIDSETRYDEAITLEESIALLVDIYKTLPIEETSASNGDGYTYNENNNSYDQTYTQPLDYDVPATLDEIKEDSADGWSNGQVHYYDDNTTYLIWADGTRYELYEELPDGERYTGVTPEDAAKVEELRWQ